MQAVQFRRQDAACPGSGQLTACKFGAAWPAQLLPMRDYAALPPLALLPTKKARCQRQEPTKNAELE